MWLNEVHHFCSVTERESMDLTTASPDERETMEHCCTGIKYSLNFNSRASTY
jgi:hypothetical protein